MENGIKRIGILTSGGDAPGMNAAVRAITRYAIENGLGVVGIYEGYKGLIEGNLRSFGARDVSNIIDEGGTILYSARCDEFKTPEGMTRALATCRKFGVDGLITIGGDGTFRGASELSALGMPCIGIPGTIDNDITSTDYSIGFDTAVNTVIDVVDRLRDTCESHARCNVVEVMGRHAGYIALESSIAVGATVTVISEAPFDEEAALTEMHLCKEAGKRNFIVIVAEGVENYAEGFAGRIEARTGIETKFARLAHIVRGGSPTLRDRLAAAKMGVAAVDMLLEGRSDVFVCEREGKITYMNINEAICIDRMYKSRFTPKIKFSEDELKPYSPETVAHIRDFCEMRRCEIDELLRISKGISNYKNPPADQ